MTKLELMERQVIKSGRWPAEWMIQDVAKAVMELATEQVILEARLELAQRYTARANTRALQLSRRVSSLDHQGLLYLQDKGRLQRRLAAAGAALVEGY